MRIPASLPNALSVLRIALVPRMGFVGTGLGARVGSALVLLPLVALVVWHGHLPLALAAAFASGRTCFEILRLMRGSVRGLEWGAVLLAGILPTLPEVVSGNPWTVALGLLVSLNILACSWLTVRADIAQGPARASAIVFACLMSGVALLCLVQLRALPGGREWLLCLLGAVWANDSCAYFGGRALGRHHLAPEVSPGKTWEGLAFGSLGSLLALGVVAALDVTSLTLFDAVIVASIVSVLGPLGDLAKSLLKRSRGVKDAGQLIPGHGGMLDRIDSLLFSTPAILVYVALVR